MSTTGRHFWISYFLVFLAVKNGTAYYHLYKETKSCSHRLNRIKHSTIEAPQPPDISGEWTSHRCETRPGPEFLLRRYHFRANHFKLHQYYYQDPGCKYPTYGVVAEGYFKPLRPSWIVQGGTESKYTVHNVTIIPYTDDIAAEFTTRSKLCVSYTGTKFSAFRKTKILNFPPFSRNLKLYTKDFDCSFEFNLAFHELQLLRLELHHHHVLSSSRYFKVIKAKKMRWEKELYLGDIHTDTRHRSSYRPTSYQVSLKPSHTKRCHVCSQITNSNLYLPPHLKHEWSGILHLPGEWVSTRCETRQYGQFLTRQLTFYKDGHSWKGQYDFFEDPLCTNPSFSLNVKGSYSGGENSKLISGAKNYNFRIQRLKVTPQNPIVVKNLNHYSGLGCGIPNSWENNVEQDVTSTGGCVTLGIVLPNVEFEIMKMEVIHRKSHLFIGQRPTNGGGLRSDNARPASFQEPLIKCKHKKKPIISNNVPIFEHLKSPNYSSNASSRYRIHNLFVLLLLYLIIVKL